MLGDTDDLCRRAGSLIATLSDEHAMEAIAKQGLLDLIVNGYAEVLALDAERLRLQREIARLAESGDPGAAGELQGLSVMLRILGGTTAELRGLLEQALARVRASNR